MNSTSSIKIRPSSRPSSIDDTTSNVTVTLPTIHVTEVLNENILESLNELPTEIVLSDTQEEQNYLEDSLLESSFSAQKNQLNIDDFGQYTNNNKAPSHQRSKGDAPVATNAGDVEVNLRRICTPSNAVEEVKIRKNSIIKIPLVKEHSPFVYPIPKKIPATFEEAMDVVSRRNVMFYLAFKLPYSDVNFDPYDFSVMSRCPGKNYGILSSEGILRMFAGEVTFISRSQFVREKEVYTKIRQLPFFRHFRLRRSWLIWRRCIRARRIQEAKKIINSQLLFTNCNARMALSKVAELCHEVSYRCLIKFPDKDLENVSLQDWVTGQLNQVKDSQSKLQTNFRSLLLQILVTTLHFNEGEGEGSEYVAAEDKGNLKNSTTPRSSHSLSSVIPRRHLSSLVGKVVKISDFMLANTLRDLLMNTLELTMNTLKEKNKKDIKTLFSIQVTIVEGEPKCSPNFDGFLHGIRVILKSCETSVLYCQQLMPHFSGKGSAPEENQILRSILVDDVQYRNYVDSLQPLMEEIWKKVEESIAPIEQLRDVIKEMNEDDKDSGITMNDLSDFGQCLSDVGKRLDDVREVSDNMQVGVMWLERGLAKSFLIEGLRKQQQSIHHYVTRTFETRIDRLGQQSTDAWLGLELSPVTGHQLVTLLNYINSVKVQIDSLAEEETLINQMYSLIQGFEILIQPEVQTKYEGLKKDMRRLKKTLRRSVMERPGLVTKLKAILEKEVKELDKETEKLTEQVQALRFLRITSDRSEVLKMLSAAENRGINIRAQATVIAQYQADFQIEVCPFVNLAQVEAEILQKTHLWRSLFEWESCLEVWQSSMIQSLDSTEIKMAAKDYRSRINDLKIVIKESEVLDHFEEIVLQIEIQIPILESLTDSTLRPRHWKELEETIGAELPATLTLAEAEELNLHSHKDILINVARKARRQKDMEDQLEKVSKELEETCIPVASGYKKDLRILGDLSSLEHLFIEIELTFHTLLASPYALHIKEKSVEWKNILTLMQDTLGALKQLEIKWLSLEPALTTRSAQESFPMQATIFQAADGFWKGVMTKITEVPNFLIHLKGGAFIERLNFYCNQLSSIQCCIEQLLAFRRNTCPRLYLLPDEDLLQLFMNSQDPDSCERYLPTVFPGVASLQKSPDGDIIAVVSPQQEVLRLSKSVIAHHGVEDWMGRIESGIKATLKRLILAHFDKELFPLKSDVPIQVIDVARRLQWNNQMKEILQNQTEGTDRIASDLTRTIKALNEEIGNLIKHPLEEEKSSFESQVELQDNSKSCDSTDGFLAVKSSKLKNLQRIRKVTLFTASKSKTQSLSRAGANQLSRAMQKEKDLINKSKEEKVKNLKKLLPLLRRELLILTLLELRNSTQNLKEKDVKTTSCFEWMSQPRHEITKTESADHQSISGFGVCVKVGSEALEYGFEYLGVPKLTLQSPTTDRVAFNLLVTAARVKCGTIGGLRGSGKFDTLQRVANTVGQQLASFDCSYATPEKSIQQILSGGVQGGFWVLLKQPQLLPSPILAQVTQSLINIQRTKTKVIRRCVVNGTEMKLMDSFALFFSISIDAPADRECHFDIFSQTGLAKPEKKVEQFLQHPITPFLKFVPSSLPTIDSTIESFLLARSFSMTIEFKKKISNLLLESEKASINPIITSTSYIRIIDLATEISRRIKSEILKYLNISQFKNKKCDQHILLDSFHQVLLPLIKDEEKDLWVETFQKTFSIEESSRTASIFQKIIRIECENENIVEKETNCKDEVHFGSWFMTNILEPILTKVIGDQEASRPFQDNFKENNKENTNNYSDQNDDKSLVKLEVHDRLKDLGKNGVTLRQQCLSLFSQLSIYRCSTLVGPPPCKKNAVWMTLKTALNLIMSKKEHLEQLPTVPSFAASAFYSRLVNSDRKFITSTVLYCGGFDEKQLLGSFEEESNGGIIMKTLKRMTQDAHISYGSQQWLILVGPFPSTATLNFISRLLPPKSSFKDEGLGHVQLEDGLRIITLIDDDRMLPEFTIKCSPILRIQADAEDSETCFIDTLTRKFESEKGTLNQQFLVAKFRELEKDYLLDLPSVTLQNTTMQLAFRAQASQAELPMESYLLDLEAQLKSLKSMRTNSFSSKESAKRPSIKHFVTESIDGVSIIVTEEMKETSKAINQMLEMSFNVLLLSSKGNGLSTFLDYFQHHQQDSHFVIRFQSSLWNSTESLLRFFQQNLHSHKSHIESEHHANYEQLFDASKSEIVLASPGDRHILLIVEGIRWSTMRSQTHLDLLESLRSVLECQIIVDPNSHIQFRIRNINLILCLSHENHLEYVPAYLLRSSIIVQLSIPNIRFCEHLLTSELQETFTGSGDEGQLFEPLKETLLLMHEILTHHTLESLEYQETFATLTFAEKQYIGKCKTGIGPQIEKKEAGDVISAYRAPNLKSFVQFLKTLKKNSKLLSLNPADLGSYFCHEFSRIYSTSVEEEKRIRELAEYVYRKFFEEEPDRHLFWLPVATEEDFFFYAKKDYEDLLKHIENPGTATSYLFSKELFKELQKISFSLIENEPARHIVILGETGVGKISLLKLGFICSNNDVVNLNDFDTTEAQLQQLQKALMSSAVKKIPTSIVIRFDSLSEKLFHILYDLVLFSWSDNLWSGPKAMGLLLSVQDTPRNISTPVHSWRNFTEEQEVKRLKRRLMNNIRQNFHICITATEEEGNKLAEVYPNFVNECSLVHIQDWSPETLREIATRILDHAEFPQNVLLCVLNALPITFEMLRRGFLTMKKNGWQFGTLEFKLEEEDALDFDKFSKNKAATEGIVELTSLDFLECCRVYNQLLKKRKSHLKDELMMYKGGLTRLNNTSENIDELRTELGQLEPELKKTQEEAQKLTGGIGSQRNVVAELRTQMSMHEEKVKEKSDALSVMNEEIAAEIKEALPELESAERQIKILDKKDLVEVRVLNKPPELVFQVMSAICLLLNVKCDWPSIKTLLGEPSMTKRLLDLDKDSLGDSLLRKLRKFIEYPKFTPEEVGKQSKPCKPLCSWLRALDNYTQVLRNVEPKRSRVIEAERDMNNLLFEQRQLQQKLGHAERQLSEQGARYDACVCRRQQLEGAVKRASGRLQRCTRLATVLADEHSRWSKHVKKLELKLSCVYGECLLAAVAVAFLGHLESKHRTTLLELCQKLVKSCGIKLIEANFNLLENLCQEEEIQHWVAAGLYNDEVPLTQAAILFAAQNPGFALDVHQMLIPWLRRLYEPIGGIELLQPRTKNFEAKLVEALDGGKATVIIHTPIEPFDNPIRLVVENKEKSRKSLVIFVSESSAPIPSKLRVDVTPVSFAVSPRVLEEQLLNRVLERERLDLYEQRTVLTASVVKDEESLQGVDLSILKRLSEASIGLLDNEELLAAFYEAKAQSAEYRTRLAESKRTLMKISNARDKYRPVAARGRVLFSSISALSKLQKEYIFSLRYFLKLFEECIAGGTDEDVAMSFDQRIESLVLTLTQKVSSHITRAIKPSHRLVFLTCLAASVEYEEGNLTLDTWKAVTQKEVRDADKYLLKICEEDEEMRLVFKVLHEEKIVQLNLYNFQTEICLIGGAKGPANFTPKKISNFNSLLLLRLHRPRLLLVGAREVVKNILRDPSILEINSSINSLVNSKDRSTALLLWTDYSKDIISEVLTCARQKAFDGVTWVFTAHSKSGLRSEIGVPDISSAIDGAVRLGHWIVIQECSSKSLLPQILDQMTRINSPSTKPHENFRLILTARLGSAEPTDEDLILLTRPFQTVPSPDFTGVLTLASESMNEEWYQKHYQGGLWRKVMWLAAAVHTVVFVAQFWNKCSAPAINAHGRDNSDDLKWIQLKDILITYETLYKVTLDEPIEEDYAIRTLESLYGHYHLWSNLVAKDQEDQTQNIQTYQSDVANQSDSVIAPKELTSKICDLEAATKMTLNDRVVDCVRVTSTLPKNIGLVAKETAYKMVLIQLYDSFQGLSNYIMDEEFSAFRENFSTVSKEIMKED